MGPLSWKTPKHLCHQMAFIAQLQATCIRVHAILRNLSSYGFKFTGTHFLPMHYPPSTTSRPHLSHTMKSIIALLLAAPALAFMPPTPAPQRYVDRSGLLKADAGF